MMQIRGAVVDHSALERWVQRFAKLISGRVSQRKKLVEGSWRMDETCIKLKGKWVYLYRAADSQGDTIDFLLIAKRDAVAAKAFFKKAIKHNSRRAKVTIGKSGSNKVALDFWNQGIAENEKIKIRKIKYLNSIIKQDHHFIKKRTRPMLSFKSFQAARAIYCRKKKCENDTKVTNTRTNSKYFGLLQFCQLNGGVVCLKSGF